MRHARGQIEDACICSGKRSNRKYPFVRGRFSLASLGALVSLLCLWVNTTAQAQSQFPEPPPEVKTYEWAVTPATEPRLALQYKLFPAVGDRVPGNAAAGYFRAIVMLSGLPPDNPEQAEKVRAWYETAAHKLPLEEVKTWLAARSHVFDELKAASRCETCDWGFRVQDLRGEAVIMVRLQEFQQARQLARLLRLRGQIELAERRYGEAVETHAQMYRLAYELGQVPTLIVNLIGIAIQAQANEGIGELISSEDAPNLYWALRSLPDPLINIGPAFSFESSLVLRLFPFLNDADTAQRRSDEWMRLLASVGFETGDVHAGITPAQLAKTTLLVMHAYPIAKRELLAAGYDAGRIAQMPVGQVVAIYARDCNRYVAEQYAKWASVPFPANLHGVRTTQEQLRKDGYICKSGSEASERDPLMLNTLFQMNDNVLEAPNRQARVTAGLIVVEALRLHVAGNGGKLPGTLAEIKAVPLPVNPATGGPMLYRVVDNRAELLIPTTRPADQYSGRRFLLRLRP